MRSDVSGATLISGSPRFFYRGNGHDRRHADVGVMKAIDDLKHRASMEAAFHKQRNESLQKAAQVVADWQSKRKKLWIEERTVPVLSSGR